MSNYVPKKKKNKLKLPTTFNPQFFEHADNRLGAVKLLRERYEMLRTDAGVDSYQKDLLCRRAIFIALQLETVEVSALEGKAVDIGSYTQMLNSFLGVLKALGLEKRIAKTVGDLRSYVKDKERRK